MKNPLKRYTDDQQAAAAFATLAGTSELLELELNVLNEKPLHPGFKLLHGPIIAMNETENPKDVLAIIKEIISHPRFQLNYQNHPSRINYAYRWSLGLIGGFRDRFFSFFGRGMFDVQPLFVDRFNKSFDSPYVVACTEDIHAELFVLVRKVGLANLKVEVASRNLLYHELFRDELEQIIDELGIEHWGGTVAFAEMANAERTMVQRPQEV